MDTEQYTKWPKGKKSKVWFLFILKNEIISVYTIKYADI